MTEWLTEDEALVMLKAPQDKKAVYTKKLAGLYKHGQIRATRLLGIRYYDKASIEKLRESRAKGGTCAENQNSSSSSEKTEASNPNTGISSIMTESEAELRQRAVASARKTMKPRSSSHSGFSKGNALPQESRMS